MLMRTTYFPAGRILPIWENFANREMLFTNIKIKIPVDNRHRVPFVLSLMRFLRVLRGPSDLFSFFVFHIDKYVHLKYSIKKRMLKFLRLNSIKQFIYGNIKSDEKSQWYQIVSE